LLRLLVIEDEDRLSGILKSKLGAIGFAVDIAASGADASAALELINYDAAILDLGLPDGDGLAVLTATRQAGKGLPILILTARDAVEDRVAGLNAGADDYLTKPFAMAELIARNQGAPAPSRRCAGHDTRSRQCPSRHCWT
jgi:DNA-binding response OmpR family regulator